MGRLQCKQKLSEQELCGFIRSLTTNSLILKMNNGNKNTSPPNLFPSRIESLEEEIISKNVKLVVIDSVASVVRKEFDTKLQGNLLERSNLLAREASILKYLAEEFSIPVSFLSSNYVIYLCMQGGFEW